MLTSSSAGAPLPEAARRVFHLSSHFPMWIFDRVTGAVIDVNDAAMRAYASTREELLVSTVWDMLTPPGPSGVHLLSALHEVVQWTEPWMQRRRDGSEFWAEVGMIDAGDLEHEATWSS
jgi:PAS domain S-box-containing protein